MKTKHILLLAIAGILGGNSTVGATTACFHSHHELCEDEEDEACAEARPWHYRYTHQAREDEMEDPAYELEEETAWPSEREEFSDILLR